MISDLELYSDLPKEILLYGAEKEWRGSIFKTWQNFSSDVALKIFQALLPYSFNGNKISEILKTLWDLSKRESLDAFQILTEEIDFAKSDAELLRDRLKKRRQPLFSQKMEIFEAAVSDLKLPKNIKLKPSPYFEDEALHLSVSFENLEEAKTFSKALHEANWQNFFERIRS